VNDFLSSTLQSYRINEGKLIQTLTKDWLKRWAIESNLIRQGSTREGADEQKVGRKVKEQEVSKTRVRE
jgi:hypothetical protein